MTTPVTLLLLIRRFPTFVATGQFVGRTLRWPDFTATVHYGNTTPTTTFVPTLLGVFGTGVRLPFRFLRLPIVVVDDYTPYRPVIYGRTWRNWPVTYCDYGANVIHYLTVPCGTFRCDHIYLVLSFDLFHTTTAVTTGAVRFRWPTFYVCRFHARLLHMTCGGWPFLFIQCYW